MSTAKRWKVKEHYVAGEFAGYVVVTDDKYEDVVCHGIGADYRSIAVLIASAPELEADRDRLREALQVIASGHLSGMVELVNTEEMKIVWKSEVGLPMTVSEARDIARKALEGVENE